MTTETTTHEMPKTFDFAEAEPRLYRWWESNGWFKPEVNPDAEPFVIAIPPPNITGALHNGHAMFVTLEDLMIRQQRMAGKAALWIPGTDHAGIATQLQVENMLREEGTSRKEIGREEFLRRTWEWKQRYGGQIKDQLRRLGASCDWDRERFTLDEGLSRAVREAFVTLWEQGLIYRGPRLINWSPGLQTAVSDLEVEREEEEGHLYYFTYPVEGGEGIPVATTRPETILGDTAVAVHPEDERYKHLIGRTALVPMLNRPIPIIADEYVDREFGTGALKITPGHDPNDYEIGQRHNLPVINILNPDATLNANAGRYAGLDRFEARKRLWADMEAAGMVLKVEPHRHAVPRSQRGGEIVEPMISTQWFVKIKPLAEKALAAVREGRIRIVPEHFERVYIHWMENIQDWCISRQLWWGHRIPAYYCDDCGHVTVAQEAPAVCPKCGSTRIRQDEDVLDTWFSSALWPFSTLGWPEKTPELEYFYPTSVLVTAYDIIFFWVARMIFSGLEQMGREPFRYVLIHGLVRDALGRKMSKSLGNGIDPLDVIDKYGTDALRYALTVGTSPGHDLRFSDEKLEASRNFANKVWNAFRFVMMNFDENADFTKVDRNRFTTADKWILSRINTVAREVTENLERFELGIALQKIYDFIWDEFCDWYIELVKPRLYDQEAPGRLEALYVLNEVLKNAMKLLHPFMPFITEEIYSHLITPDESIMISRWPEYREGVLYPEEERIMRVIMDAIRGIRNRRLEMNVPVTRKAKAIFVTTDPVLAAAVDREAPTFKRLASLSDTVVRKDKEGIADDAVTVVVEGMEVFLPLEDLIDIEKEIERLEKEKASLEAELERAEKKLGNEGFIAKAPKAVVDAEREKEAKYRDMYRRVTERLEAIRRK